VAQGQMSQEGCGFLGCDVMPRANLALSGSGNFEAPSLRENGLTRLGSVGKSKAPPYRNERDKGRVPSAD